MGWAMQVNNAAVIGVAADEEGLKALNIDAETWVFFFLNHLLLKIFMMFMPSVKLQFHLCHAYD
jgi:hypothetical protein